eukprot:2342571-Pyramimonas_sp.AAC.1
MPARERSYYYVKGGLCGQPKLCRHVCNCRGSVPVGSKPMWPKGGSARAGENGRGRSLQDN